MCEPGQKVSQCLKAEFTEEALGSLIEDSNMEKKIKSDLKIMMEEGEEVHCIDSILQSWSKCKHLRLPKILNRKKKLNHLTLYACRFILNYIKLQESFT